jgi:POT family proton-dependent oligopeptide transporter
MSGLQHDDSALAAISEIKHVQAEEKRDVADSASGSEVEQELDGIHDGLEFPTEEEKRTLRRVADSIPWAAYSA